MEKIIFYALAINQKKEKIVAGLLLRFSRLTTLLIYGVLLKRKLAEPRRRTSPQQKDNLLTPVTFALPETKSKLRRHARNTIITNRPISALNKPNLFLSVSHYS